MPRPKHPDKELEKLLVAAELQGWRIEKRPRAYFKMKCAVCHGDTGGGDGPGGTALDPKPRNFTDATWQGATKDEEIKKAIVEGGASIGKSATMPGNPDLRSKPALSDALVKYVRGLKK